MSITCSTFSKPKRKVVSERAVMTSKNPRYVAASSVYARVARYRLVLSTKAHFLVAWSRDRVAEVPYRVRRVVLDQRVCTTTPAGGFAASRGDR
mgnify:CR=1 FL=1